MKINEAAIKYIKILSDYEKTKLKAMLSHGVICCRDYAIKNGIDPVFFNAELKSILLGGKNDKL